MEPQPTSAESQNSQAYGETSNPIFTGDKLINKRAISTASQAQSIGDQLVQADQGRDTRRAELQRALNGASPFNERVLKEKNQGHRFNISVGYLEGACGRAYAPYYDLCLDEEFVARIVADLPETKIDILRKKLVEATRRWGMWGHNLNLIIREMVDFGYCSAVFDNPYSPFWHAVRQREGLVPERSYNIASKLDLYCWRRSYRIHELYEHVEDQEAAKVAGWNVKNVWAAIASAAPDDYTEGNLIGGREILEQRIRAAALAFSYGTGAKVVHTYHQFCRESSGAVSHWIVLDTSHNMAQTEQVNRDPATPTLLYYHFEEFPSFDDLVVRFDLEHGDGYWHGSKGLAQKLYSIHRANDRLVNSGLDQTFRGGLGVLKSNSQKGHEGFNVSVNNDFVVLPPDYDAIQGVKMPTLDPTFFSMQAALLASAVQRGGDVAPEAMGVERSEKTATQSSIDQASKQIITKANLKRFIPSLSHIIDVMLKRLINPNNDATCKAFYEELIQLGFTPEELQKIERVEVFHTVEDVFGETKTNISYIADKYRVDPDADRMELKKKEVGVWLGPAAALEIIPGDADQLEALAASRLQTLEISSILDGMSVPVAPDDLHPVHITTGINWINDLGASLVNGTYSQRIRKATMQDASNIAAHLEEHVNAMGSVTGQRQQARLMEAQLKQSMNNLQQAFQVNVAKHAQALEMGMAKGLQDSSAQAHEAAPPPQQSPSASASAASAIPAPLSDMTATQPSEEAVFTA